MSKSDYKFDFASIISGPALPANSNGAGDLESRVVAIEATTHVSRADLAKHLYEMRRKRDDFLPPDLFAEPAWDIMLLLYWADEKQDRMSVSAVCASAGVPATTAMRWIQTLIDTRLVERTAHPTDLRMSWLSLTLEARTALERYLSWVIEKSC